ncbi:Ketohexokinase [Seminavis robusta]|uniref:Ketohexokinase n=1 Tax=Seminavis robusta TaxID=568900 RepID=A0A9N8DWB7_9STRA|nr:Ketohexokinase [Seminavis robusta]|eukprot:Sro425_g140110.1 Ketohexokinase (428) ;mRNA; f:25260-26543
MQDDMNGNEEEKIILILGACCLDRLLTVDSYPLPDSKIKTRAYHEVGGGNGGNVATAMALLKDAPFATSSSNVKIKLLAQVGDDAVATRLVEDLTCAGVDLSLLRQEAHSTTSFTTTIVSSSSPTRTCLFTPGTCGNVPMDDIDSDNIWEGNVVHFHTDGRNPDLALALAQEATRRHIPVSVDPEKDRQLPAQDKMMELASILFLNATQMNDFFQRKHQEFSTTITQRQQTLDGLKPETANLDPAIITSAIQPSLSYLCWHGTQQLHKQVVITKGDLGAIRVTAQELVETQTAQKMELMADNVATPNSISMQVPCSIVGGTTHGLARLTVESVGVLQNADIVDTTGAGDAFIGGYLLSRILLGPDDPPQFALHLGAWVAGKKLGGPGAQSALPTARDVSNELGNTVEEMQSALHNLIGHFGGDAGEE